MRRLALILLLLVAMAAPAKAVMCAKGVDRAGCGGRHRAAPAHRAIAPVGVARPVYAHPVDAHPSEVPVCSYHAMGERVCD
jgi:hypothetical protein